MQATLNTYHGDTIRLRPQVLKVCLLPMGSFEFRVLTSSRAKVASSNRAGQAKNL